MNTLLGIILVVWIGFFINAFVSAPLYDANEMPVKKEDKRCK